MSILYVRDVEKERERENENCFFVKVWMQSFTWYEFFFMNLEAPENKLTL